MTAMLLVGALLGIGLVRLFRLVRPLAPQLVDETLRWERARARATRRAARPVSVTDPGAGTSRTGRRAVAGNPSVWLADRLRDRHGERLGPWEQDLAVTGASLEGWLTRTSAVTAAGVTTPVAFLLVLRAAGLTVPVGWAVVAAALLGVLMVALSVNDLRAAARARREEFRRALSIYLDLVVMSMEAGRGHQEAVPAAAGIGTGWAFVAVQDAVEGARVAGITPWEALGRLGAQYGITELVELRSTLGIANDEGGRIRSTLIARAATMREARLADTQARANKATEAMGHTLLLMAMVGAVYIIAPRLLYLVGSA